MAPTAKARDRSVILNGPASGSRVDRFDIYIRAFAPRDEPADTGLARAFGIAPQRARELIASLPRVVKRAVTEAEVERYRAVLVALATVCGSEPSTMSSSDARSPRRKRDE